MAETALARTSRPGGMPLSASTCSETEPSLGHDFSRVRVVADREAGEYAPETMDSRHVLAPELPHGVQQGTLGGAVIPGIQAKLTVGAPDDPLEREADQVAEEVMRMPEPPTKALAVQHKCAHCEEDDRRDAVQTKAASGEIPTVSPGTETLIQDLRGGGNPLSGSLRSYFEPRFGHDFGNVRLHTGPAAADSARAIHARAFTVGSEIAFAAGELKPETAEGKRLLAHELTHVMQQNIGITTCRIQRQTARPDPFITEPVDTNGVATANRTAIFNARENIVAVVDQGTKLHITGKPKDTDLENVKKGQFWAKPGDTQPGLYDLYYEVEYFGKMGRGAQGAEDRPIRGYVFTGWLSLTAQPAGPSQAMTTNDWMTAIPYHGQKGTPAAIATAAKAILAERTGIEQHEFLPVSERKPRIPRSGYQSKKGARTETYKAWIDAPDTRPALARGANDIRWRVFKKLFEAEGYPWAVMTYDYTNITWGVGFSGAGGVGMTEQMMARLFNQSAASRDAFWRAGISVVGTELVAVKILDANADKAEKLRGTAAENYVREHKELLSLMTNVTLGFDRPGQQNPNEVVRQENLNAQFETFLNNTLAGSEGIIDGMANDLTAAAVAAHSVHTGDHGWGQYRGVTNISGVEAAINAQIKVLEKRKAEAIARGESPRYIYSLAQIEANIK